jgi:hypothetical protein
VLDDEAERTDVAFGELRAERANDGLGGLARHAVADRDVGSPARIELRARRAAPPSVDITADSRATIQLQIGGELKKT